MKKCNKLQFMVMYGVGVVFLTLVLKSILDKYELLVDIQDLVLILFTATLMVCLNSIYTWFVNK